MPVDRDPDPVDDPQTDTEAEARAEGVEVGHDPITQREALEKHRMDERNEEAGD